MSYDIDLGYTPAGYSQTAARRAGDKVLVEQIAFYSSEDGDILIKRLEGIPSAIVALLPSTAQVSVSRLDHLLAIIRPDKKATVYVNELQFVTHIRAKRGIQKGELVRENDIAHVARLTFSDVQVPDDSGVVFVFSVGWRKGFFYDLLPLQANHGSQPRSYDLATQLGQCYSYLLFQDRVRITHDQWSRLKDQSWFPFIRLRGETIKKMVNYAENEWDVDELLEQIKGDLESGLGVLEERCRAHSILSPHVELLLCTLERYRDRDYISTCSILYPRIEGILRGFVSTSVGGPKTRQPDLARSAIAQIEDFRWSPLLPTRFEEFLRDVYFAKFGPDEPDRVNRNTVSHGVAPAAGFSEKGALLALLILDQLWYSIPSNSS